MAQPTRRWWWGCLIPGGAGRHFFMVGKTFRSASKRWSPFSPGVPMRLINTLVVHCSATPAGKAFHASDIDRWHRERGWECIGYHYVICLDGSIEPGRPVEEVGAHVQGHNQYSIGICLIGGMNAQNTAPANTFNDRQFEALETLLHGLRSRFPTTVICGHRDFPGVAKACPSFDVRPWCTSRGIDPNVRALT